MAQTSTATKEISSVQYSLSPKGKKIKYIRKTRAPHVDATMAALRTAVSSPLKTFIALSCYDVGRVATNANPAPISRATGQTDIADLATKFAGILHPRARLGLKFFVAGDRTSQNPPRDPNCGGRHCTADVSGDTSLALYSLFAEIFTGNSRRQPVGTDKAQIRWSDPNRRRFRWLSASRSQRPAST
jgi:hypothetical protein